jgi:hypothetical protein
MPCAVPDRRRDDTVFFPLPRAGIVSVPTSRLGGIRARRLSSNDKKRGDRDLHAVFPSLVS